MSRFSSLSSEFILKQLRNHFMKAPVYKKQMVDSAAVLTALLQFYKMEQAQRFKLIRQLFLSQHGRFVDGKYCLNYDGYKKMFEQNFTSLTDIEKAQIYRECWEVGKGLITPEVFFTVLNERGVFLKEMKIVTFNKAPTYNSDLDKFFPEGPAAAIMNHIFHQLQQPGQKDLIHNLISDAVQLGLETEVKSLLNYKYIIEQNLQINNYEMQGRSIALFLKDLFVKQISIANLHIFINQFKSKQAMDTQVATHEFACVQGILKVVRDYDSKARRSL